MGERTCASDDIPTLAACGVLAYLSADIVHHLLGHAAACGALGGRLLSLSAIHAGCTVESGLVDLAGPVASLVAGLLAWRAGVAVGQPTVAKLALLLAGAFNLFWFEAQFIGSVATERDDWYELIHALRLDLAWRTALVIIGAAFYLLTIELFGRAFRGFADFKAGRLRRIAAVAYVAGGLTACLTALRDPGGLPAFLSHAAPQALILPAGLLFLRPRASAGSDPVVKRDLTTIGLAVLGLAGSILYLGPGLMVQGGF